MTNQKKLPPTQQAALDRLQAEGKVRWSATTSIEARAYNALTEKGLVRKVFQPYSSTYFELSN
jgi:hypothetical protein